MNFTDFADNIRKIREKKGMTQKEVAKAMGVSQQAYSQYESGKRVPKSETIERIARALDAQYSDFFGLERAETADYQTALNLALKESMNGRGDIDPEKLFWNLRENNAAVRYHGLMMLRQKTDQLYIEELEDMPDSELRAIAMQSFDGLNRVGKIEAVKRLAELEQLPRYSTWSKVDQSYIDEESETTTPPGDAQIDPDSPKEE